MHLAADAQTQAAESTGYKVRQRHMVKQKEHSERSTSQLNFLCNIIDDAFLFKTIRNNILKLMY